MSDLIKKGHNLIDDPSADGISFSDFLVHPGVKKARDIADEMISQITLGQGAGFPGIIFCGAAGTGKTFLMRAIIGEVLKKSPGFPMVSMGAEMFMNYVIQTATSRDSGGIETLLNQGGAFFMDDLHLLTKRPSGWERFMGITRPAGGKRQPVIIASFRRMYGDELKIRRELPQMKWVSLYPPDFETRVQFLREESEKRGIHLPRNKAMLWAGHQEAVNYWGLIGLMKQIENGAPVDSHD